jgi:hypothetical protein
MKLGKKRQAVAQKPHGIGARKKAVSRGTEKMKAAASKALKKHSEQIAVSLLDGTLKGNVTSARLLIALAEGQNDCEDEKPKQHCHRMAERLAIEPEWTGETSKAKTEPGFVKSITKNK